MTATASLQLACEVHAADRDAAVVLLHSLALDRRVWRPLIEPLAVHRTVIAVDLRGHGASPHSQGFTIEDMADDVAATLTACGRERVAVVGLSMGGCVAQAFAVRYPERVEALALIDTTAWYGEDAVQAWEQRAAKARVAGMRSLAQFQLSRWFSDEFTRAHEKLCDELLDVFAGNDLDSYVSSCRALGSVDLRDRIIDIKTPTVIIVGENDPATSPAHAADMNSRIAGSTLHVLSGAKHLTPLERPEDVSRLLTSVMD